MYYPVKRMKNHYLYQPSTFLQNFNISFIWYQLLSAWHTLLVFVNFFGDILSSFLRFNIYFSLSCLICSNTAVPTILVYFFVFANV